MCSANDRMLAPCSYWAFKSLANGARDWPVTRFPLANPIAYASVQVGTVSAPGLTVAQPSHPALGWFEQ